MKHLYSVALLLCLCLPMMAIGGEMPIIAYMGVPNDQSTDDNFRTFSECGFTVSLYGYASLTELTEACNVAHRHGVSILGHCPETHATPERAAAILKDQPGFFGYVLQDEPSAAEIDILEKEIRQIKKVDDSHVFYINLLPNYADWILQHTKTRTYAEYLEKGAATSCRQLSFDYYPVTKSGLRDGWFANLEAFRKKSLSKGIPFWGFILSVPHAIYPQPTIGSLRLQAYANLAYGAQAIQYFTYWTPSPEGENDYHNGPVDREGRKTKTYALVQRMNSELKSVARLFYGARVTSIGHLGVIDKGTRRQTAMPPNLSTLKISGKGGCVVSQFTKDGHTYLALVNKNYRAKMKVTVGWRNDTPRHITKSLVEEPMKSSFSIEAGDILLFKLK